MFRFKMDGRSIPKLGGLFLRAEAEAILDLVEAETLLPLLQGKGVSLSTKPNMSYFSNLKGKSKTNEPNYPLILLEFLFKDIMATTVLLW